MVLKMHCVLWDLLQSYWIVTGLEVAYGLTVGERPKPAHGVS